VNAGTVRDRNLPLNIVKRYDRASKPDRLQRVPNYHPTLSPAVPPDAADQPRLSHRRPARDAHRAHRSLP